MLFSTWSFFILIMKMTLVVLYPIVSLPEFWFCISPQHSPRAMCFRGSDPLHFHLVGQGLYDSPWQVLVQEWVSDQFWPMRYKGKSKEKLWGKCFHGKPSHVKSSCLFFLLIFSCLDAMPRIAAAIMPSWSHWVVICT